MMNGTVCPAPAHRLFDDTRLIYFSQRRTTRTNTENTVGDENARPSRLTRAKSHTTAKQVDTHTVSVQVGKENGADARPTRKRAALNDVSNHTAATTTSTAGGVAKKALAKTTTTTTTTAPLRSKSTNTNIPVPPVQKRKVIPKASQETVAEAEPPLKKVAAAAVAPTVVITKDVRAPWAHERVEPVAEEAEPQQLQQDWDDLDAEDIEDPLMVSEYVAEIFRYLREQEIATMPDANYMSQQKELQWKMRGILVDWLIEVHTKFRLLPETLFLAVHIVDRFLTLRVCSLPKLQLVGITALFIASKYEEVMCPSIANFIYMADGGYTDDEILQAEQYVLQTLDFNLSYPNPMNFLRRVSKADQYDIQVRTVAKYLLEISLVDHHFLCFPPSALAAAGMYLARTMLDRGGWDANLIHFSGYTEGELVACVLLMLDYLQKPVQHEAFFKKYASRKFIKSSLYVREWVKKPENLHMFDHIDDTGDWPIVDDDYE